MAPFSLSLINIFFRHFSSLYIVNSTRLSVFFFSVNLKSTYSAFLVVCSLLHFPTSIWKYFPSAYRPHFNMSFLKLDGDKALQISFLRNHLHFTFIFEGYFHWVYNSRWSVIFLSTLKKSLHFVQSSLLLLWR